MCKRCDVYMKAIEITVSRIQSSNDGVSLDKGPIKALKNGL